MTEEIELNANEQDAILSYMIESKNMIEKCMRVRLKSTYFSSTTRQNLCKTIYKHFDSFKSAPADSLLDILEKSPFFTREEALKDCMDYCLSIFAKNFSSEDYYINRVEEFCRDRIIITAVNDIIKFKDRVTATPARMAAIMTEALDSIKANNFASRIELLNQDPLYDFDRDIITKFMIPEIDKYLGGGLKVGSFTVLLAYTGIGKSWAAGHLCKIANRLGNSALYIPTEMANRTVRLRWKMQCSGFSQEDIFIRGGEVRTAVLLNARRGAQTYLITEEEKDLHVDDVPSIVSEIEEKFNDKIKLIVFDSLDETQTPKNFKSNEKIEKSTEKYTWFKNYLKDNSIAGATTTQAQRRGETARWLKASHVGDDINKIRKATIGISLNQSIAGEEDCDLMRVFIFKHTDGPAGAKAWVKRDLEFGQFVTDSGRYTDLRDYKETVIEKQAEYEGEE